MSRKGIIAIISGFSGAGKGTVVNELVKKYGYAISISATTRQPREGENEGINYFYKTREEFEEMIKNDELIEYAEYVGNYYGTPKDYVFAKINNGIDVLLEIEMQGALKVKKAFPEVSLIFITPPSYEELRRRLEGRGTEAKDVIDKRMARAIEECSYMDSYDYVMVNDDLDKCVTEMHNLLQALHYSRDNQEEFIEAVKQDFKSAV